MWRTTITLSLAAFLGHGALAAPEWTPQPAELLQARAGLPNVLAKLAAGKPVTIAYFGGSITAANGWRPKTLAWFKQTWPNSDIKEVHAAIGGTPSSLGAFRLGHDVLRFRPDLVFVEFSVNDGGMPPNDICRAMEGIVRQVWQADPTIDLCYTYTFRVGYEAQLDQGLCSPAASVHEQIAAHYGIPSINMSRRIAALKREGKLLFVPEKDAAGKPLPPAEGVKLFTDGDGVHPNDTGHTLYTEDIAAAIGQLQGVGQAGPHLLPPPLLTDNWERAKLVAIQPAMLSAGWSKLPADSPFVRSFGNRMPDVFEGRAPGDSISFKFKGTTCQLYDLMGPDAGQVSIKIDGVERGPVARFDSYCTYHRLATIGVCANLPDTVHEVTLTIHPDQPKRNSVTDRESQKPGYDPKKYEGTVIRLGAILLIGDLVP
ncbi:MAG: SGNH/GDSL hydrolase family protein [Fimbriimonadaceae bacterium]|nr:SGNH/GDSL hydrolase family protein [Fimbriimonadaceae bacterium]